MSTGLRVNFTCIPKTLSIIFRWLYKQHLRHITSSTEARQNQALQDPRYSLNKSSVAVDIQTCEEVLYQSTRRGRYFDPVNEIFGDEISPIWE